MIGSITHHAAVAVDVVHSVSILALWAVVARLWWRQR